jgi:hypothetical protein
MHRQHHDGAQQYEQGVRPRLELIHFSSDYVQVEFARQSKERTEIMQS